MVPNVEADDKCKGVVAEEVPASPAAVTMAISPIRTPAPSEKHVLNCQFSHWQPLFKHCTPRSVILDLPEDVVRYLQEDSVVLPKGFDLSCGEGVQDDSDDEVDWGNEDDDDDDDRVRTLQQPLHHSCNACTLSRRCPPVNTSVDLVQICCVYHVPEEGVVLRCNCENRSPLLPYNCGIRCARLSWDAESRSDFIQERDHFCCQTLSILMLTYGVQMLFGLEWIICTFPPPFR